MRGKIKGLDSVRAIAAIGVFVHHVEEFKKHAGIDSIGNFKGIGALGGTSVTAFFVLSGFLLSLILMREKEKTKKIKVKYFYLRRILRIWPLYFITLIVYKLVLVNLPLDVLETLKESAITSQYKAISNIVLPDWLEWILLIFMLPHVLLSLGVVFNPAHVWSIGVEETFYLIWPFVILYAVNYLRAYLKVIAIYLTLLVSSLILLLFATKTQDPNSLWTLVSKFVFSFLFFERISCMAIGAIAAYIYYFNKQKVLKVLKSTWLLLLTCLILAMMVLKGIVLPIITNEIYSILFAIIIINLATNSHAILNIFDNKILSFYGKISYGLYMYNPFIILITIEVFFKFGLNKQLFLDSFLIFYLISFSLTTLIAYLSYRFLEAPFLKLKKY